MEVNLTPGDVRLGAELACAEMLLSGVTGCADHCFHAEHIAEAAVATGIRAGIAPTYFSSSGREALERGAETAVALHGAGGGRVRASLGPHAPYTVDDDDLARIADLARETGLRAHIHAAEHMEQTTSSHARIGVTSIEVLERTGVHDAGALIAHGRGITEPDPPRLAAWRDRGTPAAGRSRTGVSGCKACLRYTFGQQATAVGHNTLDVREAMRLVALTQKQAERDATWMTVSDTIRVATRGGARALGLGDRIGALEVGRAADVVLVDLRGPHCRPLHDPAAALVYSVRASDVRDVVVDGRVVVRDGRPLTADVPGLPAGIEARVPARLDTSHGRAVQHYDP